MAKKFPELRRISSSLITGRRFESYLGRFDSFRITEFRMKGFALTVKSMQPVPPPCICFYCIVSCSVLLYLRFVVIPWQFNLNYSIKNSQIYQY